jgi:energy-coupling factor transporter transmembrane protein EcfT
LLEEEWRAIHEAQRSRGMQLQFSGLRQLARNMGDLVAFTVPAIVLTTKRAWSITEAAYARGFDAPHRSMYRRLRLNPVDWLYGLLALAVAVLMFWR